MGLCRSVRACARTRTCVYVFVFVYVKVILVHGRFANDKDKRKKFIRIFIKKCIEQDFLEKSHSPSHVGSLPDQTPFDWQTRDIPPISMYPRLQTYVTRLLGVRPVRIRRPFDGVPGSEHWTCTAGNEETEVRKQG